MGLRVRKSVKMGPVRINFSKNGVGASIGVKGARVTKTAKGTTRVTMSIPGTGISYVEEHSNKKKSSTAKSGNTKSSTTKSSTARSGTTKSGAVKSSTTKSSTVKGRKI